MDYGTLTVSEYHPAADDAVRWIRSRPAEQLVTWQESFCSCAIEGNRLAEICAETLRRVLAGEPVSDRYVLGLAWAMSAEHRKNEAQQGRAGRSSA